MTAIVINYDSHWGLVQRLVASGQRCYVVFQGDISLRALGWDNAMQSVQVNIDSGQKGWFPVDHPLILELRFGFDGEETRVATKGSKLFVVD